MLFAGTARESAREPACPSSSAVWRSSSTATARWR